MTSSKKLKDLGQIITGNTPSMSDLQNYESDDICFIKPSDINEDDITTIEGSEFFIAEYARKKARVVPKGSILVTCIGSIGKIGITAKECSFNQQINAIIPNTELVDTSFLSHSLLYKKTTLQNLANSAVVPIINKSQFSEIEIKLPSIEDQKSIAGRLDFLDNIISLRKQQLSKLDQLVKARFVEMFGDPIKNNTGLPTLPMTDVCSIIDGDRGVHYPKQEDFSANGYCLFLNAKNVTPTGFNFNSCQFITKQKDHQLRKGKLLYGDIVLTTRGTIGNLAYYTKDIPFNNVRINSGMVILRMKDIMSEVFFIEQFKMQLIDIKEKIASGSAQPQLPISTMNKISMVVPPLPLQKEFAAFVQQVDKTKAAVKQSLEKLETLKKSLMQEYFG